MKTLTREQVIRILMEDQVYSSLNLDVYFDSEEGRYPSIYELLEALGIDTLEIDAALNEE